MQEKEKSKFADKVKTIMWALGVMVTLQGIASPFVLGYLRDRYSVQINSFNANTDFRTEHKANKEALDASLNNILERIDDIEKKSVSTTMAVGLRVNLDDGSLWYRNAHRMLYNAYPKPFTELPDVAYYYTDSKGIEWPCE